MVTKIKEELRKIEAAENVKITLAVESGSRAWGFESPDSDYDVRFIYVRNKEDYLRLDPVRDVIEWELDEVLDISGWDIRKAPPMLFDTLVDTELEDDLKPFVSRLPDMKKVTPEMGTASKIDEINEYIERKLEEIQSAADALVDTKTEWEPLNELFLKILDGR